jgi:hypothetical protein
MCSSPTTTHTGPIEHCLFCHRSQDAHRSPRRLATFASGVATVSVVCFTSTSSRHDQVFAPYTLKGFVYVSPPGLAAAATLRGWLARGERAAQNAGVDQMRRRSRRKKQ